MNKLTIWIMVSVLLVCAFFAPKVVYAWDDPITGSVATMIEAPPQLSVTQAFRWMNAMPSARPHLAELYGVSPEIAKLYRARYIVIGRVSCMW